ncbi:uro-adherence factor A-like [Drosophila kikkawai]|uniref:Uro-adherence factor A-like n=1 Tax=Drosophila kikkawai TaxID=30033 RepID=A0ABM4GF92_DROKI
MEESLSFPAMTAVKATAPPPLRRTLYLNESLDQEVTDRAKDAREKATAPAYATIKTKRRETLLMQVSMEEEIIYPATELHSVSVEKINAQPRNTLHVAEELKNEIIVNPGQELPSKARKNVLLDEPMEEEIVFSLKDPPDDLQMATKSRQTPIMEQEQMQPYSKEESTIYPLHKSRNITRSEAIEEDESILQPREPSLQKYKTLAAPRRPNTRHTLLMAEPLGEDQTLSMAEPLEKDHIASFKSNIPIRESSRSKARNTILMAEPILEDLGCNSTERQPPIRESSRSKAKNRNTILMAEPILEDLGCNSTERKPESMESQISGQHMVKKIEKPEEIEQDMDLESPTSSRFLEQHPEPSKPRKTILQPEPIEEDEIVPHSRQQSRPKEPIKEQLRSHEEPKTVYQSFKPRKTIIKSEHIEEDEIVSHKLPSYLGEPIEEDLRSHEREPTNMYQSLKPSKTIANSEPIEETQTLQELNETSSWPYRQKKSRQTLVKAEPIEEDPPSTYQLPPPDKPPRLKSRNTILVSEEIIEDLSIKSINKPESLDYQSPQEAMLKPNPQVITPSVRESGSSNDRTFKSYAVATTKFMNLSGDTTIFAGAIDVDKEEEEEGDEM